MSDSSLPPIPPPETPPAAPAVPPAPPAAGGYAPPAPAYSSAVAPAPAKTLSLIGMIGGILGVVALGWFLPASIAAIVLGSMGKKREGAPAKGFWLTAIITGWVGIGLTVLVVGGFFVLFAIGAATSSSGYYNN